MMRTELIDLVNGLQEEIEKSKDESKYKHTFDFMKKQQECDDHNYNQLLLIEPSHLTRTKIEAMLKLDVKWRKENTNVVSKYKDALNANKKHCYCELIKKEKQWSIIWS